MKHGIISECKRNGIGKSQFITKFFCYFCNILHLFYLFLSFLISNLFWTFSVSYSPGSLIFYYFISGYSFTLSDHLISILNVIFTLNELPLSWLSSVIIVNLSWLFLCNSKVWPVMYTHNSQIYVPSSEISWELQMHISNYMYDIAISWTSQT